jgi:hypothetical protein
VVTAKLERSLVCAGAIAGMTSKAPCSNRVEDRGLRIDDRMEYLTSDF